MGNQNGKAAEQRALDLFHLRKPTHHDYAMNEVPVGAFAPRVFADVFTRRPLELEKRQNVRLETVDFVRDDSPRDGEVACEQHGVVHRLVEVAGSGNLGKGSAQVWCLTQGRWEGDIIVIYWAGTSKERVKYNGPAVSYLAGRRVQVQ